jgi:hypothetical protein
MQAEPDIHKAVTAFCEATVNTASDEARGGCMMAAATLGQSERVTEIRPYVAQGLTATADIFDETFRKYRLACRQIVTLLRVANCTSSTCVVILNDPENAPTTG